MRETVWIFVGAFLCGLFAMGNLLVAKQLVQLKELQAKYEERREDICIEYKAMNIVFKFHDEKRQMFAYCWPDIMTKQY